MNLLSATLQEFYSVVIVRALPPVANSTALFSSLTRPDRLPDPDTLMKHQARKRFGQNFLHDDRVIDRMIQALRLQPDDPVVEVGPGLAALTRPLLEQLSQLHVIEIDRDLIARLRQLSHPGLVIHEGDVLEIDWHQFTPEHKLRIVGNLPYNIGTPLLLKLLHAHERIIDIHVMLQYEVVERLHAQAGTSSFGRLSVMMQSVFDITPLFNVPASAFEPAPKVQSAVVRLRPLQTVPSPASLAALEKTTRIAFSSKRKTLRNNFKGVLNAEQLQTLDIDPQARAETLSVHDFSRLAQALGHDGVAYNQSLKQERENDL